MTTLYTRWHDGAWRTVSSSHIANPFVCSTRRKNEQRLEDWGSLHFVDGVREVKHLCVQLVHQWLQLLYGIQYLDPSRVWVEPDLEGSGHLGDPPSEFVFHVVDAVGHVVDGLIFLILVGLDSGGSGIEWSVLWLVRESVEELSVGAEESSSVHFGFAAFFAETEFYCEPVNLERQITVNKLSSELATKTNYIRYSIV